MTGLLVEQCW